MLRPLQIPFPGPARRAPAASGRIRSPRAARFAADGRRRKNGGTASAHQPSARRGKRGLRIHPRPIRFIRTVEHEAEHLLEVAEEGESAETPAIVLGMVVLVLLPVFAMMLCAAFAAYYLT